MLKSKFPKKYCILAIVFIMGIFIVTAYVLAADDNANDASCALGLDNCDNQSDSTQCLNHGFNYTPNGYPGGAGNLSCCGDDSSESFSACSEAYIAWSCSSSDTACCVSYDCVKNGQCYDGWDKVFSGLNPGGNDNIAITDNSGGDMPCDWNDCDWGGCEPACLYIPAGESGVGEYSLYGGGAQCCGDDSQEYYIQCIDWNGADCGQMAGKTLEACCNNSNDCVYDGNCYDINAKENLSDSYSDNEICSGVGGWVSQDSSETWCVDGTWFPPELWWYCDGAGEGLAVNFCDDYNYNTGDGFCCEDDANENYVNTDCSGNPIDICCPDGKLYVQNDRCVSSCDNIAPTVDAFSVDGNTSDFDTCNTNLVIDWTASDTGGSGLKQAEVWREIDGGGWVQVDTQDLSGSGDGPVSGSWTDNMVCDSEDYDYKYGVHIIDGAGNCIDESGAHCGGVSSDSLDPRTSRGPITAHIVCTPGDPSNMSFPIIEPTLLRVSWVDNSSIEDGFYVYGRGSTDSSNRLYDRTNNFVSDSGLNCDTQYYYWVSAYNSEGSSVVCESSKTNGSERTLGCGPDFSISALPDTQTINYPDNAVYTVTLKSFNGFADTVDLTDSNCPVGASCTFNPSSVPVPAGSSATSILTVSNSSYNASKYTITITGTKASLSHDTTVELKVDDNVNPQVDELTVDGQGLQSPPVTVINTNGQPDIAWTVGDDPNDPRGSGLDFVQVWRADTDCATALAIPALWNNVSGNINQTGFLDSGSWRETTNLDNGDYCYGLHVDDLVGNTEDERNLSHPGEPAEGPIQVRIAKPVADFDFCKTIGTNYNVEFSNLSTDADGNPLTGPVLDYYWDFYLADGLDLPTTSDSRLENPVYDYAPHISQAEPEARIAGVSQEQFNNLAIEQLNNKTIDKSWWQKVSDFFIKLWNTIKKFIKDIFTKQTAQVEAKELINLRTYNSATFKNPDNSYTLKAHAGHINYQDKTGQFQAINTNLIQDETGWYQNKASYYLRLPEYADDWFEFSDMFENKNQVIKIKPVADHIQGELITEQKHDWQYKKVIYPHAFGSGYDLEIISSNNAFKKLIKINQLAHDLNQDLEFDFELELPEDSVIQTNQGEWDKQTLLRTKGQIKIGQEQTGFSYLREFYAWDNSQQKINIEIELYYQDGKLYFKKIIPQEFLSQAVYPVYTDAQTSYDAGIGDGYVENQDSNWDNGRNDISGDFVSYTPDTSIFTQIRNSGGTWYFLRSFVPIDTSSLPGTASISAAALNLYILDKYNEDNDGQAYIRLVQTSQAAADSLITDDFDQIGTTAGANDRALNTISTNQYETWDLNATGLSWISTDDFTLLGLREGHDVENQRIADGTRNRIKFAASESSGTNQDPYLLITYTYDIEATLYIDDGAGGIDSITKPIVFETMPDCPPTGQEYYLTNVNAVSCDNIGGTWSTSTPGITAADFDVYRCQGDSVFCSSSSNYTALSVGPTFSKLCGDTSCLFDNTDLPANTEYYYYINRKIDNLNNSTDVPNPACTGGLGPSEQICPLNATTPACAAGSVTLSRHCGYLTVKWNDVGANAYRLLRCVNKEFDKCLDKTHFENNNDVAYEGSYISSGYDDNEIIPINIINPSNKDYYCYKVINQLVPGGPWSSVPSGSPTCEYSFCYRAPSWQER